MINTFFWALQNSRLLQQNINLFSISKVICSGISLLYIFLTYWVWETRLLLISPKKVQVFIAISLMSRWMRWMCNRNHFIHFLSHFYVFSFTVFSLSRWMGWWPGAIAATFLLPLSLFLVFLYLLSFFSHWAGEWDGDLVQPQLQPQPSSLSSVPLQVQPPRTLTKLFYCWKLSRVLYGHCKCKLREQNYFIVLLESWKIFFWWKFPRLESHMAITITSSSNPEKIILLLKIATASVTWLSPENPKQNHLNLVSSLGIHNRTHPSADGPE